MIHGRNSKSRAFVLIVALGVLGVLGLLAATFATLSRVERSVSNSYVDKVRARMLAQSGVERAIASLRGRMMFQSWDDTRNDWYYREMLDAPGAGLNYPPASLSLWAPHMPSRLYGMPPRSLDAVADTGGGVSFPEQSDRTVSGRLPGTYAPDGDVYYLKVLDCASMINVNDGHFQVVRMLNNLGGILKCSDGTPVASGGFQLGTQIQNVAVARKKPFNSKSEILTDVFIDNAFFAGNPTEARKRFDAVKEFITCHGWTDGMTTRFVNTWNGATDYIGGNYATAISGGSSSPPSGGGDEEFEEDFGKEEEEFKAFRPAIDSGVNPLFTLASTSPGAYSSIPATSFLAALPAPGIRDLGRGGGFKQVVTGKGTDLTLGGETKNGKFGGSSYLGEPRTPINVNTCSREVLVACLMDLEATFWDYETVNESDPPSKPREYTSSLVSRSVKISKAQAEAAASFIISARHTFGDPSGSWSFNDWMHFEDEVLLVIPGLDRFQRALIRANANPNSNIRKLNPDLILVTSNPAIPPDQLVRLDKSDVKVGSTDFTFSSNGFFEIECIGRVTSTTTVSVGGSLQGVLKVLAEEKIETVVKVCDVLRYTTQEQFEKDRSWTTDPDGKEGDLKAGGFPPVVSMPEYAYNPASNPVRYRSLTGDTTWCADYDGYLVLNGPAKILAGTNPGPAAVPPSGSGTPQQACWGPHPPTNLGFTPTKCAVSFVAGFNFASLYPAQSHRNAWHRTGTGKPPHPEYAYTTPHCFGDGKSMNWKPAHSHTADTDYKSGSSWTTKKQYQIEPTQSGANFWDEGCDLQNFGVYINGVRRNRFNTYWADEVPAPDATIEMMVKPEIDLWNWATRSKPHKTGTIETAACTRQFLFDWGVGGTHGMNYTVRCYVQLSRVYLEFHHKTTNTFHVIYADHQWKPHTWHHVEVSWLQSGKIPWGTPPVSIDVPPTAMLFVDGIPAAGILAGQNANTLMGKNVFNVSTLALPENVMPVNPNQNYGTGPRFALGSHLQSYGGASMTQPRWHGTIDNVVMHHWRAHDEAFTPRNRYHSVSYYEGLSGLGYKMEKAGVYKKRLTAIEAEALTKPVTLGTLACSHYHPWHVHLYGHDGAAPTTSFGHITPSIRLKSGGTHFDIYNYDGCVGVKVQEKVEPGMEVYYMGWFEVASLVPVTMSPILTDITLTYFTAPVTYYRLSSSEGKK